LLAYSPTVSKIEGSNFIRAMFIGIADRWEVSNYKYVSNGFDTSDHFDSNQRVQGLLAHWHNKRPYTTSKLDQLVAVQRVAVKTDGHKSWYINSSKIQQTFSYKPLLRGWQLWIQDSRTTWDVLHHCSKIFFYWVFINLL
jgi:hypothetical protein